MIWAFGPRHHVAHNWIDSDVPDLVWVYRACSGWPKGNSPHWEQADTLRLAMMDDPQCKRCLRAMRTKEKA